jgi:hypothetical protein
MAMRRIAKSMNTERMTMTKVSLNFGFGTSGMPVGEEVGVDV